MRCAFVRAGGRAAPKGTRYRSKAGYFVGNGVMDTSHLALHGTRNASRIASGLFQTKWEDANTVTEGNKQS